MNKPTKIGLIVFGFVLFGVIAIATTQVTDIKFEVGNCLLNSTGMHCTDGTSGSYDKPYQKAYDIVVCRANSGYDTSGCDVVCSDDDCSNEIQQGLSKGNTTVYLKKGVYPIYSQLNISSNTLLKGSGRRMTILNLTNNIYPIKNADSVNGNSEITLEDFMLDINGASRTNYGWIAFSGVSNSTIKNLNIRNARTFSIIWQAIGDAGTGIIPKGNDIIGNIFDTQTTSSDFVIANMQESNIKNNYFYNTHSVSNYALSTGRTAKNLKIEGNVFENCYSKGIGLEDTSAVQILGNSFLNVTNDCIYIDGLNVSYMPNEVIIANNIFQKCGAIGINLAETNDVSINNNIINVTGGSCIQVLGTNRRLSNINVNNNQVSYCGNSKTNSDGIYVSTGNNTKVNNNIISFVQRYGVGLYGINIGDINDNQIVNTNLYGYEDMVGSGIRVYGTNAHISIKNNLIRGNSTYPIHTVTVTDLEVFYNNVEARNNNITLNDYTWFFGNKGSNLNQNLTTYNVNGLLVSCNVNASNDFVCGSTSGS